MPGNSAYVITNDHAQNERIFEELLARVTEALLNQTPGGPSPINNTTIIDNLDSDQTTAALSAHMGKVLKEELTSAINQIYSNIVNNVTSDSTDHFLSAKMGKELSSRLRVVENAIAGGGGGSGYTSSVPRGCIVMWSGTLDKIPAGWALCDGVDGRPNLLDKFVKGVVDSTTNPGTNGGANEITLNVNQLPSHNHNILHKHTTVPHSHVNSHIHDIKMKTDIGGAHEHEFSNDVMTWKACLFRTNNIISVRHDNGGDSIIGAARKKIGNVPNDYFFSETTKNDGNHVHNIRGKTENSVGNTGDTEVYVNSFDGISANTGQSEPISITPAYYELAFIIKL